MDLNRSCLTLKVGWKWYDFIFLHRIQHILHCAIELTAPRSFRDSLPHYRAVSAHRYLDFDRRFVSPGWNRALLELAFINLRNGQVVAHLRGPAGPNDVAVIDPNPGTSSLQCLFRPLQDLRKLCGLIRPLRRR